MLTLRRALMIGRGGAAAAWTPASITGLQLWLESDSITGSDGDAVSTWVNQAGSVDATQATADNKPLYKVAANGLPASVRFDGSNDFLTLGSDASLNTSDTITWVILYRTSGASRQALLNQAGTVGAPYLEILIDAGARSVYIPGVQLAETHTDDGQVYELWVYRRDGAGDTHTMRTNGIARVLNRHLTNSFTANAAKEIGRRGAGDLVFAGDIVAMLQYSVALTDAQIVLVESYYLEKYGYPPLLPVAAGEFCIVHVPDRHLVDSAGWSQWITRHVDALNIQAVLMTGDMVVTDGDQGQWDAIEPYIKTMQDVVPHYLVPGNHDYDNAASRLATTLNARLGQSYYTGQAWASTMVFAEVGKSENAYWTQVIDGNNYLFMGLEFGPRQAIVDWANGVIAANPTYDVILFTHSYTYRTGARVTTGDEFNPHVLISGSDIHDGAELGAELVDTNSNIVMVLSGHDNVDPAAAVTARQQVTRGDSTIVNEIYAAYHSGDVANVRILRINPTAKTMDVFTWRVTNAYRLYDANNQFQVAYKA